MKKKQEKGTSPKSNRPVTNRPTGLKRGNSIYLVLLGLIIAFVLFVRLQFLHIPFERDEGEYCYMGQLVLDGKVPYIGFYEMKPPVLYYSYAALLFVFGKTAEAMHVAFMLLNILTIILMYFIGKKLLKSQVAGLVVAAAYAILSLAPFVAGFTVQSEHIIAFFLASALLLLLLGFETGKLLYFFFSGLLLGLTFMVKQNGIFFIAFGGIITIAYSLLQKPADRKELIKRTAVFSAGVALVFAVIVIILYKQGALRECIFWTYYYSKEYVSSVSVSEGATNFTHIASQIIDHNILMWLLAVAGFVLPFFFKQSLSLFTRIFIWLFALLSFMAITPGWWFYGHYWIFFMPAIALLTGAGFISIKDMLLKFVPNNSTTIATGIVAVVFLYNITSQREYYFNHDDNGVLRMVYQMNPFPEAKVVGDYIKQNTTEKDSIGIFGSEAEIYFYSGRRCPSKHCLGYQMLSSNYRAHTFQKEYEHDMESALPKYFVVFKNPASFSVSRSDSSILNWLNAFLANRYNVICMMDMLSPENTQYVWGNAVNGYRVRSEFSGYIFQRK